MGDKMCYSCREVKPLSEYGKNSRLKNGLQTQCKGCVSIANKERYAADKEKHIEKVRAWQKKNRKKVLRYKKRYRKKLKQQKKDADRRQKPLCSPEEKS